MMRKDDPEKIIANYQLKQTGNRVYNLYNGEVDKSSPDGHEIDKDGNMIQNGCKCVQDSEGNYEYKEFGIMCKKLEKESSLKKLNEPVPSMYMGKEVLCIGTINKPLKVV